jgi:hypothetical protein
VTASNASGYQWQGSTDGGVVFADLPGATAAALTRTAVPLADDGHQLRVVVSTLPYREIPVGPRPGGGHARSEHRAVDTNVMVRSVTASTCETEAPNFVKSL